MTIGVIQNIATYKTSEVPEQTKVKYFVKFKGKTDDYHQWEYEEMLFGDELEALKYADKVADERTRKDLLGIYQSVGRRLYNHAMLKQGDSDEETEGYKLAARENLEKAQRYYDEYCSEIQTEYNRIKAHIDPQSPYAAWHASDDLATLGKYYGLVKKLEEHIANVNAAIKVFPDLTISGVQLQKLQTPKWLKKTKELFNKCLKGYLFKEEK